MLRHTLAPILGALLTLTACSSADSDSSGNDTTTAETDRADGAGSVAAEPGAAEEYVALGDSYTAAFQTGTSDATDGCYRSEANYPNLVAEATGASLTDVSCGGATTAALDGPQTTLLGTEAPPQLDALSADTDLVTVRIGGNDFDLFATLAVECVQLAEIEPDGAPCRKAHTTGGRSDVANQLDAIQRRLEDAVAQIRERAPGAQVLMVGYPQIVPPDQTCDLLPLAKGDYAFARSMTTGFNEALRAAASSSGVEYVDAHRATAGHHICADEPWVAGKTATRGSAVPYHPYPEEQQATAEAILAALGES